MQGTMDSILDDGRQKADAGDLLNLWVTLDEAKSELPVFVTADIKRIPPVKLTSVHCQCM